MKDSGVKYAFFYQRILAQLLDIFLLIALLSPLIYLTNALFTPLFSSTTGLLIFQLMRFAILMALVVYVMAQCYVRYAATPGKLLFGLKVLNSSNLQPLTVRQATLRILFGIVAIFSGIGILIIPFDKKKQGIHDKALHTVVVQSEDDYAREANTSDLETLL